MERDMESQWPSVTMRLERQKSTVGRLSPRWDGRRCRRSQPGSSETSPKAAGSPDLRLDADETVLLAATRMGNQAAFDILIERYTGRIHRLAFRITRNREDAEDAVQDCFQNAFLHFRSFRGQSRFSTWLTRIALNCALMKIRGRRRETVSLDESIDFSVAIKYRDILSSTPTRKRPTRVRNWKAYWPRK